MVGGVWGEVVVGLVGYPGSGKDTIAGVLEADFGFTRVAFGDGVKRLLLASDPAYRDSLWHLEQCKRDPHDPLRTRERLQRLGQSCREMHSSFWIDYLIRSGAVPGTGPVVVTDIRYPNELDWVTDGEDFPGVRANGVVFGVHREGCGAVNDHETERNTESLLQSCDFHVHNDGPIAESVETLLLQLEERFQ